MQLFAGLTNAVDLNEKVPQSALFLDIGDFPHALVSTIGGPCITTTAVGLGALPATMPAADADATAL